MSWAAPGLHQPRPAPGARSARLRCCCGHLREHPEEARMAASVHAPLRRAVQTALWPTDPPGHWSMLSHPPPHLTLAANAGHAMCALALAGATCRRPAWQRRARSAWAPSPAFGRAGGRQRPRSVVARPPSSSSASSAAGKAWWSMALVGGDLGRVDPRLDGFARHPAFVCAPCPRRRGLPSGVCLATAVVGVVKKYAGTAGAAPTACPPSTGPHPTFTPPPCLQPAPAPGPGRGVRRLRAPRPAHGVEFHRVDGAAAGARGWRLQKKKKKGTRPGAVPGDNDCLQWSLIPPPTGAAM